MTRALLAAAGVLAMDGTGPARALLVDGDRIAWRGDVDGELPRADRILDLGGAWITPAFVDAHVHATATGLALRGVDLAGARSAAQCLDLVHRHAAGAPPREVIIGIRWDDFGWPEGRPPTAASLTQAAGGRTVLLVRVDGHSCVVDERTLARLELARLEGVDRDPAGAPTGWLREAASEAAMAIARSRIPRAQLRAARRATCARAAALGIGSLHEMGHPGLSGLDDARAWAAGQWPVEVLTWWAAMDLEPGLRPGGDLFLDGSIGTCTAATSLPYRRGSTTTRGRLFHPDEAVAQFFVTCTRAGRGAGVHAIGDRAIEQAVAAIEAAASVAGLDAVRACRHRIEHVVLASRGHARRMARLGVTASMQPAFDATWGGDGGLYAARLGAPTARDSNPFAWFEGAGVPMAFGSDSTVTPLDPWGAVVAAQRHLGGWGLSREAALRAHTIGGRHAAAQDDVGPLRPGLRADLAVWSDDPLAVEDPRALRCLATVVAGRHVFGQFG
ncbi:MAG: amidohydrolase [Egibacteraceae bacterium]